MKTFTLDEAQSLLPVLERLLDRALTARTEAARLDEKMAQLKIRIFHSGGLSVDVAATYRDAAEQARQHHVVTEVGEELDSIGVQVKDLDRGLLDFPCVKDGELVLLCWQRGEESIEYWHTMEAGFQGRQKLDPSFGRGSKIERLH